MGQQQLLLLVLGIVIVGLAVVVGIQAFGENQQKANADAMVNDGVRIASDAQAWVLKPQAFGGGNGSPSGLTLAALGYSVAEGDGDAGDSYTNLNGSYTIDATATSVTIRGENTTNTNTSNNNKIVVAVYGATPDCIATAISSGETDPTPPAVGDTRCGSSAWTAAAD